MIRLAEAFEQAWRYHQAGDWPRAEQGYRAILQADPAHADAWCFLGAVCQSQGKLAEAEAGLRRALELAPDYITAQNVLGIVLAQQGRLEEAVACFEKLLQRHSDDPDAHNNLGNILNSQGNHAEAIYHCRQALRFKPDLAEAHNNLGSALRNQGKLDEAALAFEQALRLNPSIVEAHLNLGSLCNNQGRLAEAAVHFQEALRLRPSNKVRVTLATLLPPVFQSLPELHEQRQRLIDHLQRLHREPVRVDLATDEPALDMPTLFYLAYQGLNDRDIQRAYAGLYLPLQPLVAPVDPRPLHRASKIRIGFLSRFFLNHTIGRLMCGLMAQLSRDIFEVVVLSIGPCQDALAQFIQQHADQYVRLPAHPLAAAQIVARQQLDVLFYTDLGMDPTSYALAHSRLAPVQCVTWGHPVTTGIRSIDYFISSGLLESDESDHHYTEQLVRLQNLAIYYYRPEPPSPLRGRAAFGLPETGTLYACPQSLFKFHPEFDAILGGILREDLRGTLVLIQGKHRYWEERLRQRFATTLPDVLERVRFVPQQGYEQFLNLTALADVLLDPIHFGGGNTSYEGLALGVPIVTLPTPFLRGRITLALYQQMGVMDCIATSPQEYIDRAVRLGTDADYRELIRAKILAANHVLFENSAGIRELEQFLQQTVARFRSPTVLPGQE